MRYSSTIVFPVFVLIVTATGISYAYVTQNKYTNNYLAQVHIAQDEQEPVTSQNNQTTDSSKLSGELAQLQYPGSGILAEATNSARLESLDDSETITTWYKDKINAMGFTSKSFITANTNGNIENKFMATRDNQQLYIEVKKPNGFIKTAVNLELN